MLCVCFPWKCCRNFTRGLCINSSRDFSGNFIRGSYKRYSYGFLQESIQGFIQDFFPRLSPGIPLDVPRGIYSELHLGIPRGHTPFTPSNIYSRILVRITSGILPRDSSKNFIVMNLGMCTSNAAPLADFYVTLEVTLVVNTPLKKLV